MAIEGDTVLVAIVAGNVVRRCMLRSIDASTTGSGRQRRGARGRSEWSIKSWPEGVVVLVAMIVALDVRVDHSKVPISCAHPQSGFACKSQA